MRERGNVREGARERSRGGEGTFVRDEGTFARGDLQGHRSCRTGLSDDTCSTDFWSTNVFHTIQTQCQTKRC